MIRLRFVAQHRLWNAGEEAGFPEAEAGRLIAAGVAVHVQADADAAAAAVAVQAQADADAAQAAADAQAKPDADAAKSAKGKA